MATIKSYTDISQSKKLEKILPLESADMAYYFWENSENIVTPHPFVLDGTEVKKGGMFTYLNCWSLAALLAVLPNGVVINKDAGNGKYHFSSTYIGTYIIEDNPVDACVAMIEKLHKLKIL